MRKILRWALGGVAALAVAAGLVVWTYWDTIQDYRAALEYADSFKPDVIDQNFRSLFVKYPSIRVPKSALASPPHRHQGWRHRS
jgi:high-affinity Fe2+/Pb2+ permease